MLSATTPARSRPSRTLLNASNVLPSLMACASMAAIAWPGLDHGADQRHAEQDRKNGDDGTERPERHHQRLAGDAGSIERDFDQLEAADQLLELARRLDRFVDLLIASGPSTPNFLIFSVTTSRNRARQTCRLSWPPDNVPNAFLPGLADVSELAFDFGGTLKRQLNGKLLCHLVVFEMQIEQRAELFPIGLDESLM